MEELKYKLIFSDYDDTLTRTDNTVSDRTRRAIAAYRKAGGRFVVITGRSYASISRLLIGIYGEENIDVPVVAFQGGLVHSADGKVLSESVGDKTEMIRLAEKLSEHNEIFQVYSGSEMFCHKMTVEARRYEKLTDCKLTVVPDIIEFMRNYSGSFNKILIIVSPDRIIELKRTIMSSGLFPNLKFIFSRSQYLEAIPIASGKDAALNFVCHFLNVPIKNTIAVGDSDNDIDMIKAAGLGVAMGNGRAECKAAADLVADHTDNDGLAQIIEAATNNKL